MRLGGAPLSVSAQRWGMWWSFSKLAIESAARRASHPTAARSTRLCAGMLAPLLVVMIAALIQPASTALLDYVQPVFRPPGEAGSLILQVTTGCSWNRCSFCDMYRQPQQQYKIKPLAEIEAGLDLVASMRRDPDSLRGLRIFLADGDAMGLPSKHLAAILERIRDRLPECKRISSYCLPRNVRGKSLEELRDLEALGLRTMYVGCESGDDDVLARVGKGETMESSVAALRKLNAAGLKTSVMILHGLGGKQLSEQHVRNSAELVRRAPPTYLSTLVVSFPLRESLARHAAGFADLDGGFQMLSDAEVVEEQRSLIERLDGLDRNVIFRSDHASNYLPLKGTLPRDHGKLMAQLDAAQQGRVRLRPEWARGL